MVVSQANSLDNRVMTWLSSTSDSPQGRGQDHKNDKVWNLDLVLNLTCDALRLFLHKFTDDSIYVGVNKIN